MAQEVGTPLYISHVGMCRPKGCGLWAFLVRKRVYTLPILVRNREWFLRELQEHINVFIVSIPNEEERNRNRQIRNAFEEFFCFCSSLSNYDINYFCLKARSKNRYGFERPGLKTGVENDSFWSEIGSGFGETGSTHLPKIPRSTLPTSLMCYGHICMLPVYKNINL